jgi:predicted transcriptional regulator YdeE
MLFPLKRIYKENVCLIICKYHHRLTKKISSFIKETDRLDQPKIVKKDEIKIVGIEAHTTNEHECTGQGEIPQLWGRYFGEQIASKISTQISPDVTIGLYSDYENEIYGLYSIVLGMEVSCFDNVPEGMVSKVIPPATYAVFTIEKGLCF